MNEPWALDMMTDLDCTVDVDDSDLVIQLVGELGEWSKKVGFFS